MATTLPSAGAAAAPLTPSEQVLLDAETHSTFNKDGGAPVLKTPGRHVDGDPLARAMLAAALLANEAAGALRLEMGIRKSWFGLVKKPEVQVHPGSAAPAWPAGTLEEVILTHGRKRAAKGRHDARGLYDDVVDRDVSPELETALRAVKSLASRGLTVEVEEQKTTLKVFKRTVRHPALAPAGEAALRAAPPAAAADLLARCARERPELWAALADAVRHTLAAKTIDTSSSDSRDFGGSD